MSRPPEARIFMHHPGILTKDCADADGLALIEVNGEIVGHLPYVKAGWEWAPNNATYLSFSVLAGKSDLSSRELKDA